ncbi:16S rRNA (uracil(1498)-N(3))-methyltransferase [Solimonas sp. K1W22B-7]|uniref:16S rRNA (uracil(1498)-N(3))-methyltransferase n=1 Tax=Solimonas sp. K1W22B-7 TaxID=2303331 RepID=UPI000E3307CE|nr:16S rRNA (uracil(1498)-N(3))-methyltransferase [Solimonas sp. K1W22B-7]AXQ29791.1 16S rRNA (uracil(1498)-N(3))-methyltransferase [Solimonas sp. K1W22B-7]
MIRIHLDPPLREDSEMPLPEEAFRHLVQVLRLREGEPFTVFCGDGGEYEATLSAVARRSATLRLGARREADRESPLLLTLAQCVSKGDRMDYTLQKAVELGVQRIQPLLSARSVVKLDGERWEKKLEHWRGVIVSACEQSGRTRLPELAAVQPLERWLPACAEAGLRLTLDPLAAGGIASLPTRTSATLLIGPEGGLSEAEIRQAAAAGFQGLRVGPRILRTETAGVAVLAALQARFGDWG